MKLCLEWRLSILDSSVSCYWFWPRSNWRQIEIYATKLLFFSRGSFDDIINRVLLELITYLECPAKLVDVFLAQEAQLNVLPHSSIVYQYAFHHHANFTSGWRSALEVRGMVSNDVLDESSLYMKRCWIIIWVDTRNNHSKRLTHLTKRSSLGSSACRAFPGWCYPNIPVRVRTCPVWIRLQILRKLCVVMPVTRESNMRFMWMALASAVYLVVTCRNE